MFNSVSRLAALVAFLMPLASGAADPVLTVVLRSPTGEKPLKSWDAGAFQKLKSASQKERDPETGEVVSWKGVSLAYLIEQALDGLPINERSQIDLVILKNGSGQQAFVPRSLIAHYPMLLAAGPSLGARGPWYSVVPWTSKPKILKENLPLERYFVPGLTQVELTNYRNLYSAYFLARRTDPAAVRGEKIFVQNCLGCHATAQVSKIVTTDPASRVVASQGEHSTIKGAPRLESRDWRAIMSYFSEYKNEASKAPIVSAGGSSGGTQ